MQALQNYMKKKQMKNPSVDKAIKMSHDDGAGVGAAVKKASAPKAGLDRMKKNPVLRAPVKR